MTNNQVFYLDSRAGQALISVARHSLVLYVQDGLQFQPHIDLYAPELRRPGASFVTLTNQGVLRGCIGMVEARRPLVVDVAKNCVAAASRDPRFDPLECTELDIVRLSITVLTPPEPLLYDSYDHLLKLLLPGEDGIILSHGNQRGILLPQVWQRITEPAEFLENICRKALIPVNMLHQVPPSVNAYSFRAQHFYEAGYLEPGGSEPDLD